MTTVEALATHLLAAVAGALLVVAWLLARTISSPDRLNGGVDP